MKLLPLSNGQNSLVDDEDFSILNKHKWTVNNTGHVWRNGVKDRKNHGISISRFIMGFPKDCVDHINGNLLDNRKSNLRICKLEDNAKNKTIYKNNKSGFKGVVRHKGRWQASIAVDKKDIYLGMFQDKDKAALAYNEAAKKYHGEFAKLNIIDY